MDATSSQSTSQSIVRDLQAGSGIDINSIVGNLIKMAGDAKKETLDESESSVKTQVSDLAVLKQSFSIFSSNVEYMKSSDNLEVMEARSSAPSTFTASATSKAEEGSYSVRVDSIAQVGKYTHNTVITNLSDPIGSGTLDITVGSNTNSLTVPENTTLSELKSLINENSSELGIKATTLYTNDGNTDGYKLIITTNEAGSNNTVSITTSDDSDLNNSDQNGLSQFVTLNTIQPPSDTDIYIDGQQILTDKTRLKDYIAGVTIDVLQADLNTTHSLTIEKDHSALQNNITTFVASLNNLRGTIGELTKIDPSDPENNGSFAQDFTITNLTNKLQAIVSNDVSGNIVHSTLIEIGIEFDLSNREYKVNQDKLTQAISANATEVVAIFSNSDGIANKLNEFITEYSKFGGVLDDKNAVLSNKITNINSEKTKLDEYLQDLEDRYLEKFIAMEQTVTSLNSTKSYLEQTFDALNKSD